jgi:Fe-S-cluster containining protein
MLIKLHETNPLTELHGDIDQRVDAIRAEHPDWLCRSGCEGCCHRLAEIPQLTAAEWALLQAGLSELPEALLQGIRQNVEALAEQQSRPIVCPMLNQETGTCRVYLYRPTACRTYGFYVQRDKGLYCKDIEAHVDIGALDNVVWGNQDAIDQQLKFTGETRELTAWFADWGVNDRGGTVATQIS